jgi:hypothetical protein
MYIEKVDGAVAVETLGKRIAKLTEQGELHSTAIPGLSLFRLIFPLRIAC